MFIRSQRSLFCLVPTGQVTITFVLAVLPFPAAFWTLPRLAFRTPALVSARGAGNGLWFRAGLDTEGPPNIVAGQCGGALTALLDHLPELGIAPE